LIGLLSGCSVGVLLDLEQAIEDLSTKGPQGNDGVDEAYEELIDSVLMTLQCSTHSLNIVIKVITSKQDDLCLKSRLDCRCLEKECGQPIRSTRLRNEPSQGLGFHLLQMRTNENSINDQEIVHISSRATGPCHIEGQEK
jgi:hypothetical protein